jgi:DNA-binding NarL/FixJ family response regulator
MIVTHNNPQPIRVILKDDHRRVHEAASIVLASAEDIRLFAHGSNGQEAIQLCQLNRRAALLIL